MPNHYFTRQVIMLIKIIHTVNKYLKVPHIQCVQQLHIVIFEHLLLFCRDRGIHKHYNVVVVCRF